MWSEVGQETLEVKLKLHVCLRNKVPSPVCIRTILLAQDSTCGDIIYHTQF